MPDQTPPVSRRKLGILAVVAGAAAVDAALATVISRIKTRSHAAGRTDEMVDAELAAASAASTPS